MAVGKNERISKSKKGVKKKTVDPFSKKDWYGIKAPSVFNIRNIGKTLESRVQGTKIALGIRRPQTSSVRGPLADPQNDEDQPYRKIRLRAKDVQDMSTTAFIEPLPVIEFVPKLLNWDFHDVLSRPLFDSDCVKIKKALRGVKVEVTHKGNMRRKYRIAGLTSQATRELTYASA